MSGAFPPVEPDCKENNSFKLKNSNSRSTPWSVICLGLEHSVSVTVLCGFPPRDSNKRKEWWQTERRKNNKSDGLSVCTRTYIPKCPISSDPSTSSQRFLSTLIPKSDFRLRLASPPDHPESLSEITRDSVQQTQKPLQLVELAWLPSSQPRCCL